MSQQLAAPSPASVTQHRARRYSELDGLRGIAAVSVLCYHYFTLYEVVFGDAPDPSDVMALGAMGVQLFFMISGFVILMTANRYPSPFRFAEARAVRLYPTYWACLTITILTVYMTGTYKLGAPSRDLVINYTMLQSFVGAKSIDGAYWSLSREIIFYGLIFIALCVFRRRLSHRFFVILAAVWSSIGVATCLVDHLAASAWSHLLLTATAGQYAGLFSIGMILYEARTRGHSRRAILALLPMSVTAEYLVNSSWVNVACLTVIISAFIAITSSRAVPLLQNPVITWFGAISYPLYLVHQNIGYIVILNSHTTIGLLGAQLLAIVVVVALAWSIHELVEVRISRWINGKIRNRTTKDIVHDGR
ncbi:acyltransferase [Acidipropionibacterium acidipropionici]|uniref:Acyltransferase 3 domain-containing protein n=1 Tax=Acidipropionibacterium acidipropionici TaxID=1748 RepID=A0AAC8YG31_9ACTN|nr:acyltransferase [Acidipropionibacterium acidipropionici]AMS06096.1 hypothetical protein AXH35_12280 [Acidipropionibacterium acidipropionici]AOZ47558.1 hypothetical protein A8L58_13730 [Acidipropionibacterium acidipropionici]AZP39119.1 acyltransferase [Acidipropionibacterium acidipropionici]